MSNNRSGHPKSSDSERVRLHKFIAECGVASRRKAEDLIAAGKVKVNGEVVTDLGVKIDPANDQVEVKNTPIRPPQKGIVLFHKPRGIVSTLDDPEGRPCVADYLTKHIRSYFPVGRLDFESTGLLVLTNDGELADRMLHPRYGCEKVYEVRVEGRFPDALCRKIENGVMLEDGPIKGEVRVLEDSEDSTLLEITISEGRNRILRRLMDKLDHPVVTLTRVAHGPFRLAGLRAGGLKKLTENEYSRIRRKLVGGDRQDPQR